MKPDDLINHYGTVEKAASAIGVTIGAVYQWLQSGEIPPMRQSDIEVKSDRQLLSDFTLQRRKDEKHKPGSDSGTG
ncbi:hypothetical protein F0327_25370 [Citrobacter braakii]|nr:hypothetical protein F0327_25370 [Citrobacter braakii]